eukprot:GDKJ01061055.1.p1 GENE.GDKJ01061055.1~~GDKJ01061055.1.p1  ORF type:complete len:208 (-),score=6.28 GDKJ01061055.1:55-678(-)
MKKEDENMEWKSEAPYLASLAKHHPYSVPDNYFNELSARINQTIFVDGLMLKENQGFTVPENYFNELSQQIESKIATEKLLNFTANESGFKVPDQYFDQLSANILSKTTSVPKTKVVRLWHSDLVRYASAACFILLVASGLYVKEQNNVKQLRNTELASEHMLYDIDESVIIEHIQETSSANNTATNAEMESYILDHFSSNDLSNNL